MLISLAKLRGRMALRRCAVNAKCAMLLIVGSLLVAAGCQSELETGYKPKKLGVTDEERRAYYAPAFSPESAASTEGNVNALKARRPTP